MMIPELNDMTFRMYTRENKTFWEVTALEACEYGYLNVLMVRKDELVIDEKCMDMAARYGNLNIVRYLHSIGKDCTKNAMDSAAMYGHLEVVKYLHSIGEECTTDAIDWAATYGHLDVVEYLHSIEK